MVMAFTPLLALASLSVGMATVAEDADQGLSQKQAVDVRTYTPVVTKGVLQPGFEQREACRTIPQGAANAGEEVCRTLIVHTASQRIVSVNSRWISDCRSEGKAIPSDTSTDANVACHLRPRPASLKNKRPAATKEEALERYEQRKEELKAILTPKE